MAVQRETTDTSNMAGGTVKRRGILAAAALAVGMLTTRAVQPVAAITQDTEFSATGGNGVSYDNFGAYNYGVYVDGVMAGVRGGSGSGYGVQATTTGSSGIAVYAVAAGAYGVWGQSTGGGYGVAGFTNGSAPGSPAAVFGQNTSGGNAIGVQGDTGSFGIGVLGTSGNGAGVRGQTSGGYAVQGVAVGGATGVRGESNSGTAVQGVTSTGGFSKAVYGQHLANGYGVYGEATGVGAVGVYGTVTVNSPSAKGVQGNSGAAGYGVYGSGGTGVYGSGGIGVQGFASAGIGVYGISGGGSSPYGVVGAVTAPGFALYGVATVANSVGFAAGGTNGAYAGQFSGQTNFYGTIALVGAGNAFVVGPGVTKNAAVQVGDGSHRLLHCVEAPEPWFEDFGEGTLAGGKAEVKLEATFAAVVDASTLHVFLTAHDENHIHIAQRSTSGFTVQGTPSAATIAAGKKAGDLAGTFTYRVVAKRKDVKGERFARFELPKEIKLAPPPLPPTSPEMKAAGPPPPPAPSLPAISPQVTPPPPPKVTPPAMRT